METLTLQVIPYTTRLEEVIWGSGLMAISLMIHGFGMLATLHICNRFKERFGAPDSFMWGMASIILGSWLITLGHIAEVAMWAGFFHWKDCFKNFSTAVYFAGLQYHGGQLAQPAEGMAAAGDHDSQCRAAGLCLVHRCADDLAQEFREQQLRLLRERRITLGLKLRRVPPKGIRPRRKTRG
ncbi:MAG: hypothetical protein IPP21_09885 [Betaproteobacteria bacterium]|nr:hypothetical protein [Betaproteobacteria bacterium]